MNFSAADTAVLLGFAAAFKSSLQQHNDGWSTVDSQAAGNFSTNHSLRSAIAVSRYLMLTSSEAIYPDWRNDSSAFSSATSLSLTPDESYLYTFSANPPISGAGFWSLTACDEDNYLISNELGVYASVDRSNLTYPSGQSVYGNSQEAEGMFQTLGQAADVKPPSHWTENWLPGPAGGGAMTALLRFSGGDEELLDGTYQ